MKKFVFAAAVTIQSCLIAHCQMPCGIYHDDMVFNQIDQYVETMIKAVSVMNHSSFQTVRERNEFVRWVMEKENESDATAELIVKFFLQQKIKPGESDTAKRLESAHKLLFLLVAIKQNADEKMVMEFHDEWNNFKLMFHIEGYECAMEKKNMAELDKLRHEREEKEAKEVKAKQDGKDGPVAEADKGNDWYYLRHKRAHEEGIPHTH